MSDNDFALKGMMSQIGLAGDLAKLSSQSPTAEMGKAKNLAEAEKAAKEFESLLVTQMMKSMWATTPADKTLFGSKEEEHYRDMLTQEISKQIAEGPGMGIAPVIMRELKERIEKDK